MKKEKTKNILKRKYEGAAKVLGSHPHHLVLFFFTPVIIVIRNFVSKITGYHMSNHMSNTTISMYPNIIKINLENIVAAIQIVSNNFQKIIICYVI